MHFTLANLQLHRFEALLSGFQAIGQHTSDYSQPRVANSASIGIDIEQHRLLWVGRIHIVAFSYTVLRS